MPSAWCSMCAEKQFDLLYHAVLIISALDRERKHGTLHILHYALYAMICIAESGLRAKWSILGQNHVHINTDIDRKETCNGRKKYTKFLLLPRGIRTFRRSSFSTSVKANKTILFFLSQRRRTNYQLCTYLPEANLLQLKYTTVNRLFYAMRSVFSRGKLDRKVHMTK